jgi:glutamate dehydrogenase/leucine dehydrogenase
MGVAGVDEMSQDEYRAAAVEAVRQLAEDVGIVTSLKGVVKEEDVHQMSVDAAEEYGLGYDLVAGANLAGFKKVAEAMMEQGIF